eukprot:c25969_g1_i3 orf=546-1118(+)
MAAASPFKPQNHSGPIQGSQSCSVCLEPVSDGGERSMAKLKCGHHFHLDCIGSAFNVKGTMQCPNCRHIEDGQWLYANGGQHHEDLMLEDIIYEDSFDIYAGVSELFFPHDETHFGHLQWCPYRGPNSQISSSFEEAGHPPVSYSLQREVYEKISCKIGLCEGNCWLATCPFFQRHKMACVVLFKLHKYI